MESRKQSLSSLKTCRFCLSQTDQLSNIYEKYRAPKTSVTLPLKILSCLSIEPMPSDKMPIYICNRCKFFMDITFEFKHMCRQADENILQYVQNAAPLTPITWSQPLQKLFRLSNKSPEISLMKTVVEGGTTVQVTAQESESDEEDDENVYNVKIGDGSDEGLKSRVKVITADKDKEKAKKIKGFSSVAKLSRHVRTHAGDRSYPCKYCDKSFVKSHHYTRHLRLKHRETIRTCRGPFGESDQYRCEQCEDSFATQDELIYHSAIHATQNLICPLCQEKFQDVDELTAHIKSHANGSHVLHMCDLCELVFTSQDKLDAHIITAHEDELPNDLDQDESSTEMEVDDEEFEVKEEDDHMVVEVKKPDEFVRSDSHADIDEKLENTNSEESEAEMTFTDLATVDTIAIARKEVAKQTADKVQVTGTTIDKPAPKIPKITEKVDSQPATILRKAEEIKKKIVQAPLETVPEKKMEKNKPENSTVGASDKSLRLLEKELQELKRTNTRSETVKTPAKNVDLLRYKRTQMHTSTPKVRATFIVEDKKLIAPTKSPALEKKQPERRVLTKENKEPKDIKEIKTNNITKEDKEVKEKETPKTFVKNGNNDKNSSEDGVRRSTRPSKIKDYAKMIRDKSQDSDDIDDSDDSDDEEYKEIEKSPEIKKGRRSSVKQVTPKIIPTKSIVTPTPRKRGRPRKEVPIAPKVRKEDKDVIDDDDDAEIIDNEVTPKSAPATSTAATPRTPGSAPVAAKEANKISTENVVEVNKSAIEMKQPSMLVSPTGQTLKKIPIKALPPGVKPLPLPVNARPMAGGEVCEMQIGKKVVKVQKIVMTKAEVEAMAKKGLVEMKDGTMVLKQGIKIPTSDPTALKTSLVGDDIVKESPAKKAAPTRCNFGEEA